MHVVTSFGVEEFYHFYGILLRKLSISGKKIWNVHVKISNFAWKLSNCTKMFEILREKVKICIDISNFELCAKKFYMLKIILNKFENTKKINLRLKIQILHIKFKLQI